MTRTRRNIIIQGDDIQSHQCPDWLRDLIDERRELEEACDVFKAKPEDIIAAYDSYHDPFHYLKHLGAEVVRGDESFEGGGPGGSGYWQIAYLAKSKIPETVRKGTKEIREGHAKLRVHYLIKEDIDEMDPYDFMEKVDALEAKDEAQPGPEEVRIGELEEELAKVRGELQSALAVKEAKANDADLLKLATVADHQATKIAEWVEIGLWPHGPFARLNDGSVAYMKSFLDQTIEQDEPSAKALEGLRKTGVVLHAVECSIYSGVRAWFSGRAFGRGVKKSTPEDLSIYRWELAWEVALQDRDNTQFKFPQELKALGEVLVKKYGVKVGIDFR